MQADEVLQCVKTFFRERKQSDLSEKLTLQFELKDLSIDSLEMVEMIMFVENELQITFDDSLISTAVSIKDISDLAMKQA